MCVVFGIIYDVIFKNVGYILLCGGFKPPLGATGILLLYPSIGVELVLHNTSFSCCLLLCCNGNSIKPVGNIKSGSEDTKHFIHKYKCILKFTVILIKMIFIIFLYGSNN